MAGKPKYSLTEWTYKIINKGRTVMLTLPKGEVTFFDVRHLEKVRGYRWYRNSRGVIQTTISQPGGKPRQKTLLLHRLITNCPPEQCIDHKDGQPNNNRDSNLRICSHAQNMQNQKGRGIRFRKGRWEARITFQGKAYFLGGFTSEEQALRARQKASKELRKEFAPEVNRGTL